MLVLYTVFFYRSPLILKFFMHYESQILLRCSQYGFQKVEEPKGHFSFLAVIKWGSSSCCHPLKHVSAKVLLASTYTEASATGLKPFSDLPPAIQTTAAKTWGQVFCFVLFCFPLYLPLQATDRKRGIVFSSHSE